MTRALLATLLLAGCALEPDTAAPAPADAGLATPARVASGTDVRGALDGVAYRLRHAAVRRGRPGDPRTWICVADVPVSFADCERGGPPARTMLLGPIVRDRAGAPVWALAQVGLYRIGDRSATRRARSGRVTATVDDPETGALDLGVDVDFGGAAARGRVVVDP